MSVIRLKLDECVTCRMKIWREGERTWVDETGGDGCEEDVHIPLHDISDNPYNPRHSRAYGMRLLDAEYSRTRPNQEAHDWLVGKLNERIEMDRLKHSKEF